MAADWRSDVAGSSFADESHAGNDSIIKKADHRIENIRAGSWVKYPGFDFGESTGCNYAWVEAASARSGGTVEMRLESPTGPVIGTWSIAPTGSETTYKPFGLKLPSPVKGVKDLYLVFPGGADDSFSLSRFRFQRYAPDYRSPVVHPAWQYPVAEQGLFPAIRFSRESHPDSSKTIEVDDEKIENIKHGSWVAYPNFDFGAEPGFNFFCIHAAADDTDPAGTIQLRLGSETGELIGTVRIAGTDDVMKPFTTSFSRPVSGAHDLYLCFSGPDGRSSGDDLFEIEHFRMAAGVPNVSKSVQRTLAASSFDAESHPGSAPVVVNGDAITELTHDSWSRYDGIDFGSGSDLLSIEAATPGKGGTLEVRAGAKDGPLLGAIDITHTGSWTLYRPYTTRLKPGLAGVKTVFFRFTDAFGQGGNLYNVKNFTFGKAVQPRPPVTRNRLSVYPPVPGLDPSPYYTFAVQKVAALNAPKKQDATNWLQPFAFFTECKTKGEPFSHGYYSSYIGGWSQTYCNFELDPETPVVVKITRKAAAGVPSGPITMANAHPAHRVVACEIIQGDVYVTLRNPALVTIDIDGQMDTRDVPRPSPSGWPSPSGYATATRAAGCHAVTIFANPFIADKPSLNDPTVLAVEPGSLPPKDGPWKTLYFKPGIHDLSQNRSVTNPKLPWIPEDGYPLASDKSYYIPGDAIVYGCMNTSKEKDLRRNVRVFGHGTLSGARIPHYTWYKEQTPPITIDSNGRNRILAIQNGDACRFEGVTVADPPVFGPRIEGGGSLPNAMRWLKVLTWRTNNDGVYMSKGVLEDCFVRHQDDAIYCTIQQVRGCVFWTDVNGIPARNSFLNRETVPESCSLQPRESVYQDNDYIYVRGMFTIDSKGAKDENSPVIGGDGGWSSSQYDDGTYNTAQHTVWYNVRITDPRPYRNMFGFSADYNETEDPVTGKETKVPNPKFKGWAGLRFIHVQHRHPQTFGWKESFLGNESAPIHRWFFHDVTIGGDAFTQAVLEDPSRCMTSSVSNMVFR